MVFSARMATPSGPAVRKYRSKYLAADYPEHDLLPDDSWNLMVAFIMLLAPVETALFEIYGFTI
jgi:hypothetical protein